MRRTIYIASAGGLFALVLVAAGIYHARSSIGAAAVIAYLRGRGVAADIRFDHLDSHGFSGSASLGPAGRPDLTVDHFEGRFAANAQTGALSLPRLAEVTLVGPRLRALYDGRRLTFGSLQGLINSLGGGSAGGPAPDVSVEKGVLDLATPWGDVTAQADGRVRGGHVTDAVVRLTQNHLRDGALSASLLVGNLTLQATSPQEMIGDLQLTAGAAAMNTIRVQEVDLKAHFEGPNVDLASVGGERPLRGSALVYLRQLDAVGMTVTGTHASFSLDGRLHRDQTGVHVAGRVAVDAAAAGARYGGVSAGALRAKIGSNDVTFGWRGKIPAGEGAFVMALTAAGGQASLKGMENNPLTIARVEETATGRAELTGTTARLAISGRAAAQGGLSKPIDERVSALGGAGLRPLTDKVSGALKDVRVDVPQFTLDADQTGYRMILLKTVSARSATGASLRVQSVKDQPLAVVTGQGADGAFEARLEGQGFPTAGLNISAYHLGSDPEGTALAVTGQGSINAADAGPYLGAKLAVAVTVLRQHGVLTASPSRCGQLSLDAYRPNGIVTVKSLSAQLCSGQNPWLSITKDHWSAGGLIKDLSLELPTTGARLQMTQGRFLFDGRDSFPPTGSSELGPATLTDQSPQTRFKPLTATGRFAVSNRRLEGTLEIQPLDVRTPLAHGTIGYDLATKEGRATLRIDGATLAPGGLQPASFSPLLARWASNARGSVSATANLDWINDQVRSRAIVRLSGLDFKSAAGQVAGLNGVVAFSSLAPLTADAGQALTADRVAAFIPLTRVKMAFGLTPGTLTLQNASAAVANGVASLSPMRVSLDQGATVSGALSLKGVDLQPFIDSTSLSNAVTVQARMDGVLPFTFGPSGLRFTNGALTAEGPGRLTIHRQALTGAVATAGSAGAQPNAVQDFAYQALEDLAFESLGAEVASRPEGRLGMLLHVKGRHDPPTTAPTRLNLIELARGHAFDKPIPLPKGTPVDLTLDGSLNFDELLTDYGALSGEASSAKVQSKP